MTNAIVIHYSEIALKGKNRPWFERTLLDNIREKLNGFAYTSVRKISGRFILELCGNTDIAEVTSRLKTVFGISSFSLARHIKPDITAMTAAVKDILQHHDQNNTVRILTKRSSKSFPMTSMDVNKQVGHAVVNDCKRTIDLVDADTSIWIEIVDNRCFIYDNQIKGLGGLPVGVSGKVISLLSGGIDSPVAAWYAMKRGCTVRFIHFYNDTINTKESLTKVKDLAKILSSYNHNTKLYLIPFKDIQYELMKAVPKNYRMILYKRFMLKIAENIANKEHAKALIVGDSLAQVSSQIITAMDVVRQGTRTLILSPLIGFDKQEIVDKAKDIGTYETSILPYGDCCSYMIAKHPVLSPQHHVVTTIEKHLPVDSLVLTAVKHADIIRY